MYLFRTNRVLEINWTCLVSNNTYIYVSKFYTYFKFLPLSPSDTEIQSESHECQVLFISISCPDHLWSPPVSFSVFINGSIQFVHVTQKFSQTVTNVKCFSSLYYIQIISEARQFPSQHLLMEALRS